MFDKVIDKFKLKIALLIVLILIVFSFIISNLYELQIEKGEYYTEKADNNFIKYVSVKAKRGRIFDRNGAVLAKNKIAFYLYLFPEKTDEFTLEFLKKNIKFTLKEKIVFEESYKKKKKILLKKNLSKRELSLFESRKFRLKGIEISQKVYRYYPEKGVTSHIVGYINSMTPKEYKKHPSYNITDNIGKSGAEKYLEDVLKGKNGSKVVLHNKNKVIETDTSLNRLIRIKNSESNRLQEGDDVYLSIDLELQKKIDEIFLDVKSGAAVVIDLNTGDLLASYSKPTFDPNLIIAKDRKYLKEIFSDKHQPTLDKTQKQFFPGSIFKVITAVASLDMGIIDENEKLLCPGYEEYGVTKFRCWNRGGHGYLNLKQAIAQSCDVYFYKVAKQLGLDNLNKYAKKLGIGTTFTDFLSDIPKGFVPNKKWYYKKYGRYHKGTALNTSIGQGDVYISPFKAAEVYSIIANLGVRKRINLVNKIVTESGKIKYSRKIINKNTNIPIDIFKKVSDALEYVVSNGTARRYAIPEVPVSGKTGTAQVNSRTKDEYDFEMLWEEQHHGWFIGFAPSYRPEIVVSVIVEHGGSSSAATPLVMKIIKAYYGITSP